MSARDQQMQDHSVWKRLVSAEGALSSADQRLKELSDDGLANLERVKTVVRYAQRSLDRSDYALLAIPQLNELDQPLQQLVQETNNFAENGNQQHLVNASNHADSVIAQLAGIPFVSELEDVGQLREDIASFRKSASALLRGLESEVEAVREAQDGTRARNDDLAAEIKEQRARLDNAIASAQQQVQDLVSTTQSQTSETLARVQQQFSEAQDRRSSEFETQIREALAEIDDSAQAARESIQALLKSFEDRLANREAAASDRTDGLIAEIEHQLEEAKRIVNVVGNVAMTGDYQANANRQRRRADVLQGVAVVLFIGAAVLAVWLFGNSTSTDIDVAQSIRRVAILAVAVTPAWVTLRLSRGHRDLEGKYRSIELELASLNPYLALLPESIQQAVKADLASRYFAGGDQDAAPLEVEPWLQTIASSVRRKEEAGGDDD